MKNYTQLCCWPATEMGDKTSKELKKFFMDEMNTRIKYKCVVLTKPDVCENGHEQPNTGGRSDLFFYVHQDDVNHFAAPRFKYGIRWWEDVIKYNKGNRHLYTKEFLKENQPTW